jgi:hypothetical protein
MDVKIGHNGDPVFEAVITPVKSTPVIYRSGITAADIAGPSAMIDVSSATACSTAYHPETSRPSGPFACPTAAIRVRARTNVKTDIAIVPVLFPSMTQAGGIPTEATEIVLPATDQKDGAVFLTSWVLIDVGADCWCHMFVSNVGTATQVALELRQA